MLESLLNLFQDSSLSLWGPFVVLLLCGMGLPLPEDIVLVAAGILAKDDGRSWVSTACLMYVGVIAGDIIIFFLGRFFGGRLLAWEFTHHLFPPRKQARVSALFRKYGALVLLIARFLPGLRMPIFSSAGAMKVSFHKFVLLDGLAALVSVPIFVWLGHWLWTRFADDMKGFNAALSQTHRFSLIFALVIVVAIIVVWRVRSKKRKDRPA